MSQRFRLAQRSDRCTWELVPAADDAVLVALGYRLATSGLDLGPLSPGDRSRLVALLARPAYRLDVEEKHDVARLLAGVGRFGWVPPLDLDVADDVPDHVRETLLADVARDLAGPLAAVGLGAPVWSFSGGRGAHGDLVLDHDPAFISHPDLLRAVGVLVVEAARKAGVPLLSEHREKGRRPPIVLDDTLFRRNAEGRGSLWRLVGAPGSTGVKRHARWGKLPDPRRIEPVRVLRVAAGREVLRALRGGSPGGQAAVVASWRRAESCPVCGRARCRVSPDGESVWCYRQGTSGVGRLVRLDGSPVPLEEIVEPPASNGSTPSRTVLTTLASFYRKLWEDTPLRKRCGGRNLFRKAAGGEEELVVVHSRCGSWACVWCGPWNRATHHVHRLAVLQTWRDVYRVEVEDDDARNVLVAQLRKQDGAWFDWRTSIDGRELLVSVPVQGGRRVSPEDLDDVLRSLFSRVRRRLRPGERLISSSKGLGLPKEEDDEPSGFELVGPVRVEVAEAAEEARRTGVGEPVLTSPSPEGVPHLEDGLPLFGACRVRVTDPARVRAYLDALGVVFQRRGPVRTEEPSVKRRGYPSR